MGIERLLKGDTCAYINHRYPIIFKVHVVYSKSTDRTYQSTNVHYFSRNQLEYCTSDGWLGKIFFREERLPP